MHVLNDDIRALGFHAHVFWTRSVLTDSAGRLRGKQGNGYHKRLREAGSMFPELWLCRRLYEVSLQHGDTAVGAASGVGGTTCLRLLNNSSAKAMLDSKLQ